MFINIHGGGYIYPSNEKDIMYCAHIAAAICGIVVNVEYITTDRAPYLQPWISVMRQQRVFANALTGW